MSAVSFAPRFGHSVCRAGLTPDYHAPRGGAAKPASLRRRAPFRDAAGAREAMRRHLANRQRRYRRLPPKQNHQKPLRRGDTAL